MPLTLAHHFLTAQFNPQALYGSENVYVYSRACKTHSHYLSHPLRAAVKLWLSVELLEAVAMTA